MNLFSKLFNAYHKWTHDLHPAKLAGIGYLTYIVFGWIFLSLPFSQKGAGVNSLDNLFVSTSAISTTGLSPVSVSDCYSWFGQIVILLLIQVGGIGYMTFGSFVILSSRNNLSPLRAEVGLTVFSLPASFRIDKFIRSVVGFTLIIELLGIAALYPILKKIGVETPLWSAVFHSISSFCTAGFSLYNTSFEAYAGHFWLNAVVSVLSYLGAIGFIVCVDYWRKFTGKTERVTLTSKIIIGTTLWLSVIGTFLLFVNEPEIQSKPVDERLVAAFFQSMSAMTTVGFNTIPIGQLSKASLLVLIVLMVIGASPSGTGGGLKSTTFSAIIGVMKSAIRGEREVRFWGNVVPLERIWIAVGSLGFYLLTLLAGTYLLELTEQSDFIQNLFEAASALGTVGLSMGITATLTNMGKLIITFLMFCGRLGPLTFGIVLFTRSSSTQASDTDLAV